MSAESRISDEIDAIIARAMAEYSEAKGIDVFTSEQSAPTNYHIDYIPDEETEPLPEEEESVADAIPTNSASILVEETTSRFSSAVWFNKIQSKTITLAGLGGIGSYVAFLLARMQPERIILYDDDRVEAANMSGQLYGSQDLNHTKVSAICTLLSNYANYYETVSFAERFTAESQPTDIMICGFDNMEARRRFYTSWKAWVNTKEEEAKKECLFIDGRLAAESFQILCIRGDDIFSMARYERDFLFTDDEADETICSYKQTTFMANMIGSVMVNLFVNFCANECDPLVPRDMPFYTEYTAETMFFKVVA